MNGCLEVIAIGLHLATWHSKGDNNSINPGVYVRTECNIVAGTFYNSENRMSVYAGLNLEKPMGRLTPFIVAGAITGYEQARVAPLLTAGVGIQISERSAIRLAYIPGAGDGWPHALHAAVEFRF